MSTRRRSEHRSIRVRTSHRALLAAAVCALAAMMTAASASAVIVQLRSGRRVSYQPLHGSRAFSSPFARTLGAKNLQYHGGPVMHSNSNYTFYWAPEGSTPYAAGYQSGVDAYFENLAQDSGGHQNVDSVALQYTDSSGERANYNSHFAGRILDTDPYPANGCTVAAICLTDEQIQAELRSYVESHGLPADLAHEYFVLTPPGVSTCFDSTGKECSANTKHAAFCAYHGDFAASTGTIIYANDPYVVGVESCDNGAQHPNESPSDAALQGGLSHEHNESITDPELSAWFGPEGQENGDKCRTFIESTEYGTPLGTAPDGSPYNQLINGTEYWYQQEWSNLGSTCLQRLAEIEPETPAVKKVAPKKGPVAGGTLVTITGTQFFNVTAVYFGSTPASAFTVNSPTSIVATSPAGSPKLLVDVTVVTKAGTSPIVKRDHFKYARQ